MDFLATPLRRRLLFASLYFSEGAPIGFLWLALPTRLRATGVDLEQITWLTAILVLPWTFKFAWAPGVDVMRSARWTLRHWILASQAIMGVTLLPLLWLDPQRDFIWMAATLLAHAFSAATQDVAIDALCIAETEAHERGRYNGWMQAGMLMGRACMGGGALLLAEWLGDSIVVILLIAAVLFSSGLVLFSRERNRRHLAPSQRLRDLRHAAIDALGSRVTWLGLLFGLVGGAAFKSLDVIYGPFLIDRGYTKSEVGWIAAGPMVGAMIAGSVLGGWLADRVGRRRSVAGSLLLIAFLVSSLAISDLAYRETQGPHLLMFLVGTAFGIGVFTAASYALFMDLSDPKIGASHFSAFMGSTNGCESWSTFGIGRIIAVSGYATGFLTMSAVSAASVVLLVWLKPSGAIEDGSS